MTTTTTVPDINRSAKLWCPLGFVVLALACRLFVVWGTPVIARDGMLYVGIARMINHGMWLELVADWFVFNPYPALMACLARLGLDYELSGQLISAIASGLAVFPLYRWCRSAFNERIALLASLSYSVHPVVLRMSAHVMREGLFWFFAWWAVWIFWEAAQRRWNWGWLLGGLVATAATLTRAEGIALFGLAGIWAMTSPAGSRAPHWRRGLGPVLAAVMFPVTLIALNVLFIPSGKGWHGCGRWVSYALRLTTGSDAGQTTPAKAQPQHMREVVAAQQALSQQLSKPPADVRELAKTLPAWNSLGEPDPEQLRLQRFLILADDQRLYLYAGRLINALWEGFLPPVLWCCLWGFWRCRSDWKRERDVGLLLYSLGLLGLMTYHLATEHILEPRYTLSLIPFLLPWSAIGAIRMAEDLQAWLRARACPTWAIPSGRTLLTGLLVMACFKMVMLWESDQKIAQRRTGEQLRALYPDKRLKIAGPENLKRIGHYADADYFIITRGLKNPVHDWLDKQPVDVVVLSEEDRPVIRPNDLRTDGAQTRYQPVPSETSSHTPIAIFAVRPETSRRR